MDGDVCDLESHLYLFDFVGGSANIVILVQRI